MTYLVEYFNSQTIDLSNYSSSGTVSSSIGITWHCPSTNSSPSPHSTGIGSSAIISSPRPSDVGCSPPGYSRGSLVTIGAQFSPGEISCSPASYQIKRQTILGMGPEPAQTRRYQNKRRLLF